VNALVEYLCAAPDAAWEARWPQTRALRDRLVQEQALGPIWATEVAPGCRMQWSVPASATIDRSKLPSIR
jgi:hypothetical protein